MAHQQAMSDYRNYIRDLRGRTGNYELTFPDEIAMRPRDRAKADRKARALAKGLGKYKGYHFRVYHGTNELRVVAMYWANNGLQTVEEQ